MAGKRRKWVVEMATALVPRGFRSKSVTQYSLPTSPPLYFTTYTQEKGDKH